MPLCLRQIRCLIRHKHATLCLQHPMSNSRGAADADRFRNDRRSFNADRRHSRSPPPRSSHYHPSSRDQAPRSRNDRPPPSGDMRSRDGAGNRSSGGGGPRGRSRDRARDHHDSSSRGSGRPSSTSQPAVAKPASSDKDPLKLSGQKAGIKLTLVNKQQDKVIRHHQSKRPTSGSGDASVSGSKRARTGGKRHRIFMYCTSAFSVVCAGTVQRYICRFFRFTFKRRLAIRPRRRAVT